MSMGHKLLLVTLGEYADDTDCAWPSQETLAGVLECSVSTIRRSLKALISWGLIDREERWVMDDDGNTHRATNVYRLHVGAQPVQGGEDVPEGPSGDSGPGDVSAGQGIPVNLTGMGAGGSQSPVDNLSDDGVFVANADTGQSDRYGAYTGQNRGAYRSSMVTGISIPNHHRNHQTQPDQSEVTSPGGRAASRSGLVGSGGGDARSGASAGRARRDASPATGRPGSVAAGLPAEVAELLGDCLPDSMQGGLDRQGALRIAGLLRERLDAGWRPHQIRLVMDQALPARVSRLSGLVASRLEANVDPVLAPDKVKAGAERRRQEAARRRSEEIAGSDRPAADPAFERALALVREQMPGASLLECSRAAAELVERRGDGTVGVES
ncbi:hypothetical protein BKH17_06275 [Actinomyces oris]|nr:hypothetical protein BKH17_06275 [Actinomyces oris]